MLKTKPDILFIQDIRLNNKENIFSKEVRFNIAGSYLIVIVLKEGGALLF